ncbi:hypothetical protein FHX82_004196 [Amycolatopsis bartoniae]|uniref:Uncharacterized protein n=1 Tax=Amycolatopsis bartoniae TaxID=941986 RepID=A0A8H9IWI7_9PSEU|nr:hypothetical protein [Amycolatopsis bartoniae]MBB2937132.1 hypothetical protein [Amycolatopsis bartoniae]TVT06005.1 hypothetical protein FNH07_21695 [Amycolatopsis bartoniae]GHF52660.1 hypothetical protein GCM10017566_27550 [Amycolatopsis bartoniae]
MPEDTADVALEVAHTADQCTLAIRADQLSRLSDLIARSGHREELVAMWARLLVTVVPEDRAAELVEQLWQRGEDRWLVAVEHFLDYAHRRHPASLGNFAAEVTSWPGAEQSAFAELVLAAIAGALPEGIVPSHYLVARGLVVEAAAALGCGELTDALAGLVALGWREPGALPPARLAYDLARHVEQELPGLAVRRRAIAVLALVVGGFRDPGEAVVIRLHDGALLLTDGDDPADAAGEAEKATVVAARVARHGGRGDLARIETELALHAPEEQDLLPVLLALALAAGAHVREDARV